MAASIERLADAIEQQHRLGDHPRPRYTRPPGNADLVDERTMAGILGISYRTLGKYRREGRLPGCWVHNGGHIHWRVGETTDAWERGIA